MVSFTQILKEEGMKEGIKIGEKRGEERVKAAEEKINSAKQRYIQECLKDGRASTVEEAEEMAKSIFRD